MPVSFFVTVAVLIVAIVGGVFFMRHRETSSPKIAPGDRRRLLKICRGDEGQLRRLVNYEIERRPGLTEREAARAAIARYERDIR